MKQLSTPILAMVIAAFSLLVNPLQAKPVGYAYNDEGQLFSFDLTNPSSVIPLGTPAGPYIKGIDARPGTATIYAIEIDSVTSEIQLYTVNPSTGMRSPVGPAIPSTGTAGDTNPYDIDTMSPGYGFNFNPTTLQPDGSSRIRLVTSSGSNFRFNSATGEVTNVDGDLTYDGGTPPPSVVGAASYTNSDTERAGAAETPTLLYYLESAGDNLVQSPAANSGVFTEVGPIGFDISEMVGMEIFTQDGNLFAYIVITLDGGNTYSLHTVDLTTGEASASFGTFPEGYEPAGGFAIVDLQEVAPPEGATGYAYNADGQLFSFFLSDPSTVTPVGSPGADTMKGLDFRPGTDTLYSIAVGPTESQLSTVNVFNGTVSPIGTAFPNQDPPGTGTNYEISENSQFGFDFNPTTLQADGSIRIRLVDDNGTNLRLHSDTGAVASVDGSINIDGMVVSGVTGAAYTNSDTQRMGAGETPTRLYYLDPELDRLLTSPAANAGDSVPVGDLGLNITENTGFDILSVDGYNIAYATVDLGGGTYTLHTIDLQTGAIGPVIGAFPVGFEPVKGFAAAILTPPDNQRPNITFKGIQRREQVNSNRKRFRLRGRAFDNVEVAAVFVKERGKRYKKVKGTRNWRETVRLDPGRNVFRAYAIDTSGNRSRTIRVIINRG